MLCEKVCSQESRKLLVRLSHWVLVTCNLYSGLCTSGSFIKLCKKCWKRSNGCYKVVAVKNNKNYFNLLKSLEISWERKAGWCNICFSDLLVKFFNTSLLCISQNPSLPPQSSLVLHAIESLIQQMAEESWDSGENRPGSSFNLCCEQRASIRILVCNLKQSHIITSQSVLLGCANKDGSESHVSNHCNKNSLSRGLDTEVTSLVPSACNLSYCCLRVSVTNSFKLSGLKVDTISSEKLPLMVHKRLSRCLFCFVF